MNMKLIYLLVAIFLVQESGAFKLRFLDEDEDFDVKDVARKVCWSRSGARNQITRYSTLEKLVEYFESLPVEHELSSCAKNHLKSLRALLELTRTGNHDACGEQKLALLEKFHHQHFGENYRSHLVELPRVLRSFFYQYASRISNICATISYSFFHANSGPAGTARVSELDSILEKGVSQLSGELGIKSYEDLYMLWGLLDRFSKNVHTSMSDYITGQFKRMYIRIPEPNNLRKFQQICSQSIKPIYSQTILPALRLINLGYYPEETHFIVQLVNHKLVNRLYKMTVLCETILPVGVIRSNSNDNQFYLVRPAEVEPSDLEEEPERIGGGERFIEPVSLGEQDKLPLGSPEYALERSRKITADVKSREKFIGKIVKILVKGMKKEEYSNVKLWETKESIEPMVREMKEKDPEEESSTRRRRSISTFFRQSVLVVQNVVFFLLLCIFTVISIVLRLVVFISSIVHGILKLVRTGFATIQYLTLNAAASDWVKPR